MVARRGGAGQGRRCEGDLALATAPAGPQRVCSAQQEESASRGGPALQREESLPWPRESHRAAAGRAGRARAESQHRGGVRRWQEDRGLGPDRSGGREGAKTGSCGGSN